MLRVLVLCEYSSLNGGERSFLEVARRLAHDGIEFVVAAPATGPLSDALRQSGLTHSHFQWSDPSGARYPRLVLRERLRQLVHETGVAIVHANSVSMSRLSGPVDRPPGVRSIGHLRDIIKLSAAAIGDLNGHDRLLAVSEATRSWYGAMGLDRQKTFVEYNGVDLERFCPREPTGYLHAELGLPPSIRLVGNVGQIGMRKGTDLFTQAAGQVAKLVPDVHFVVVGRRFSQKAEAREYEARVRRSVSEPELVGRVHFLDVRDDMARLLNELSMLVHAAWQEPLGRVLLESAAAGRPVVATDVGGTAEIFPGGQASAVLTTPGSIDELSDAMIGLLADPQRCRTLACSARRRAEAVFDAQDTARRLAAHYCELVG